MKYLGFGALLMVSALGVGFVVAIFGLSARQTPHVDVAVNGDQLTAKVPGAGLASDDRLSVVVTGFTEDGRQDRLFRADVGAKADGTAEIPVSAGVHAGFYRSVLVVAWTRRVSPRADDADMSTPPPVLPAESAEPLAPPVPAEPDDYWNAPPSCRQPPTATDLHSCTYLALDPHVSWAPQISLTPSGDGGSRVLTVSAKTTMYPWRSLLLHVVDTAANEVLYSGTLWPTTNGAVDASTTIEVGSAERDLCVIAVVNWQANAVMPSGCSGDLWALPQPSAWNTSSWGKWPDRAQAAWVHYRLLESDEPSMAPASPASGSPIPSPPPSQ
jgi:hypothetical protein